MAARHYDRMKAAEDANVPHLRFTIEDLSYELGYISSALEHHCDTALASWLKRSVRKWLEHAAHVAGREMKPCEAACGRLTAANSWGQFVCLPDARMAALDSLAKRRTSRKPAKNPSEEVIRAARDQGAKTG